MAGVFAVCLIAGCAGERLVEQARPPNVPGPGAAGGRALAQAHCGTCHITAPDQTAAPPIRAILTEGRSQTKPLSTNGNTMILRVPSFVEIANMPGMSIENLEKFLDSTHWRSDGGLPATVMPPPQIAAADRGRIFAYIISLRTSK